MTAPRNNLNEGDEAHADAPDLEGARTRSIQVCVIQVQEKNRLYLYVRGFAHSQGRISRTRNVVVQIL